LTASPVAERAIAWTKSEMEERERLEMRSQPLRLYGGGDTAPETLEGMAIDDEELTKQIEGPLFEGFGLPTPKE